MASSVTGDPEVEKLYQYVDRLSDAKDKSQHVGDFEGIIEAVKSGSNKAKQLAAQLIPRFFKFFPNIAGRAIDAHFDLLEMDDLATRVQAIRGLPLLCRDTPENVSKIADVLGQILIAEENVERVAVHKALLSLLRQDVKDGKLVVLPEDCRKLFYAIYHQESSRNKKRRWLMGSTSESDDQLKLNSSKFLPEQLIRAGEVSFTNVEKSLRSNLIMSAGSQQGNHIVADYLNLFDPSMIEKPAIFMETLSSALRNMSTDAVATVARVVTGNSDACSTRGAMKRVILQILPEIFFHSKEEVHVMVIKQLSQVVRDPSNFWKQMEVITPVTSSLLSSIESVVQKLDVLPTQTLIAMNRKIDGETIVPELPIFITCKRAPLINKLQLNYREFLSAIKDGDGLPKPLAKSLSVASLTLKEKERRSGIPTTDFFPFTPKIEALQNDVLTAIWSIPKVKIHELKRLKDLMDPKDTLPLKSFRSAVVKFLLEYLFVCDEIDVPMSFLKVVSFINRKSRRQLDFDNTVVSDQVEIVMNVSSRLKQILWDSFSDNAEEVLETYVENIASDDDDDDSDDLRDDIIIKDANCSDSAIEEMGDSADCSGVGKYCIRNNDDQPCKLESSVRNSPPNASYHIIQSLCDETSLLAHRLTDRVLEMLMSTGPEESDISDDIGPKLLIQAVEELVPSFPQGGLDRAKKLMGIA